MLKAFGNFLSGLGINAVALAAIGWVAWDTWQRGVLEPYQAPEIEVAAASMPSTGPEYNLNAIINAHLFGPEKQVKKVVQQKAVAPTRLNLKLVGVIAAGTDQSALALIEVSRGKQEIIRVGQLIGKTGATLSRVAGDHILIERNGKLEKLVIKRPGLKQSKPKALNVSGQTLADAGNSGASSTVVPLNTPSSTGAASSQDASQPKSGGMALPF